MVERVTSNRRGWLSMVCYGCEKTWEQPEPLNPMEKTIRYCPDCGCDLANDTPPTETCRYCDTPVFKEGAAYCAYCGLTQKPYP